MRLQDPGEHDADPVQRQLRREEPQHPRPGLPLDLAETASITLGREIDYTLGENSGHVLVDIDAALKRIDDGTYGTCVSCGNEIPLGRLEAHPAASLCIDCKRRAEGG